MTMPAYDDSDIPTIKELHRTVVDFRDEFRGQMSQMVRRDVHTVEHDALHSRLARVEGDLRKVEAERDAQNKERNTMRNQFYMALIGAALSLIVTVVVAAMK